MTRSHTRRKRELARLKAARAAERAAARRRRKRIIVSSVAGALAVVIGGTVAAVMLTTGGDGKPAAAATPTVPAKGTTTKVGTCVYTSDGRKPSKPVSMPAAASTVAKSPVTAVITTNYGTMTATLDGAKAPCTVHAFETMIAAKYFDKTPCHRETTKSLYVLQCGDPSGKGTGGPGYTYANENTTAAAFGRGVIALANSDNGAKTSGTDGSQFFINYKNADAATAKQLAGQFTVLGKVTKGLDVLDKITTKGVQGGGEDGTPTTKPQILSFAITQP